MKISVFVVTYNQEKYICQCLDSILMQKVNFDYEVVIGEDHGTDGTRAICEEYATKYPQVRLLPLIENLGIARNWRRVLSECRGEYIAMCEGDDYWTDPMKLQKQVDFLENNPDFSLCFHKVKVFDQKEGVLVDDFITRDVPSETDICELAKGNYIHTPAVVYRKNDNLGSFMSKLGNVVVRDYPMWMGLAQYGKIKKFEESMAVYRVGVGVWSGDKNYVKKNIIWLNMLCKLFVAIEDKNAKIILEEQIEKCRVSLNQSFNNQVDSIRNSYAYRLGNFILRPVYFIKKMFNHKKKVI